MHSQDLIHIQSVIVILWCSCKFVCEYLLGSFKHGFYPKCIL